MQVDAIPPLQFLGARIPHVERDYPFTEPPRVYKIFYSLLLNAPRQQGDPGDFFIGEYDVYIKSERGRWRKAYFNLPVSHPLADDNDLFKDLCLFYDQWGPIWGKPQDTPYFRSWQLQAPSVPVAVQFYRSLARHMRQLQPGARDHPILILD